MSNQIAKYLSFLEFLCSAPIDEREEQLKGLKNSELKFFLNLLYNIVHERVPISLKAKEDLISHKTLIKNLVQKNKSLKSKKLELINSGLFKTIFDILLPDLRKIVLP